MNNIIPGKMLFQKIKNNQEITENINEDNNYLTDLKNVIGQESNKKKIFKLKTEILQDNNIPLTTNLEPLKKEKHINIITKISKREIFFTDLKLLLQKKKFSNLKETKKKEALLIKNVSTIKIDRNIDKKYSFRILDLINYYDINYKNLKIDSNERINQDIFYNNIKYFNILEFYPKNGFLTCLINNKLENSDKHFVVENNSNYLKILEENKNSHNSFFHIININPEEINISEYLVNCIIFNNLTDDNYEKVITIVNNNLNIIKNNIFDIYIEKPNNFDMSSLYTILESIFFKKKISTESREHWFNLN